MITDDPDHPLNSSSREILAANPTLVREWLGQATKEIDEWWSRYYAATPKERRRMVKERRIFREARLTRVPPPCTDAWSEECEGTVCGSCGFCQAHAYEANRQGEGVCSDCEELRLRR